MKSKNRLARPIQRVLDHQQREGDPGDDIANRLDDDDPPAARALPLPDADPHGQQHEVERIGYRRGAK